MLRSQPSPALLLWLASAFAAASLAIVLLSPEKLIFDEGFFQRYAADYVQKGLTLAFVRELEGLPGPLVGILQGSLEPFTGLKFVPMRITNALIFLCTGLVLCLALKQAEVRWATSAPALLYAIPFAGVSYGLVLSEVPALLAASLGILFLAMAMQDASADGRNTSGASSWSYQWVILAGLFFAAAVWGRQNYFVVLFALPVVFMSGGNFAWRPWLLASALVLGLSAVLFAIWGGVVPPWGRGILADTSFAEDSDLRIGGLNPAYFFRGLGYATIFFFVAAPRFLVWRPAILGISAGLAVAVTMIVPQLQFLPSRYLMQQVLGDSLTTPAAIVGGSCFTFMGLWLLFSAFVRMIALVEPQSRRQSPEKRGSRFKEALHNLVSLSPGDRIYLFSIATWLGLLASNMANTAQFSSRYVMAAAPFLVVTASKQFRLTWFALVLLLIGFSASMAFLVKKYGWF